MSYKTTKGNNFENFPEIWQLCAAKGLQTPCRGSLGFMKDTASGIPITSGTVRAS